MLKVNINDTTGKGLMQLNGIRVSYNKVVEVNGQKSTFYLV